MKALPTLAQETLARNKAIVQKALRDAVGRTWLGVKGAPPAFAYPRVSLARQAEEDRTGIAREVQAIDELARRLVRYVPIENVYADDYTGQEESRPFLDRMLARLAEVPREERVVLAECMDRVGRTRPTQYLVERNIRRAGGELVLAREADDVTKLVFGFVAEFEVLNIRTRVRGGNLVRMGRGEIISPRPRFGYIIVRGPSGACFAVEPRQTRIVQIVHRWFQVYRSIGRLRYSLHRRGIRAPGGGQVWSTDTLLQILRDETYIGVHYQNRYIVERTGEYSVRGRPKTVTRERPRSEWIPVAVPAIVDTDLFAANQALLDANRGRAGRKSHLTLLRSLLFCSCGRRMTRTKNEQGSEYYHCPRRRNSEVARHGRPRCEQRFVPVPSVDALVWEELARFISSPTYAHRYLLEQHAARTDAGARARLDGEVRDAERAIATARAALDAALARGEQPDELAEAASRARVRLAQASAALAEQVAPPPPPTLEHVGRALARFDPSAVGLERRHAVVAALIDRATISADGQSIELQGVLPDPGVKSFAVATRCACGRTASSSGRSGAARPSTCSRP